MRFRRVHAADTTLQALIHTAITEGCPELFSNCERSSLNKTARSTYIYVLEQINQITGRIFA